MNRRTWISITLALFGIALIVGGALTFSRGGWGMMGPGYRSMCDSDEFYGSDVTGEPLSSGEVAAIAGQYLAGYRDADLGIAEIMEFEDNFYVQTREVKTGRYAFEFLIDRRSGRAYPEPGPNMMWNTKYGHMRWFNFPPWVGPSENMRVTADEAIETAQDYLDRTGSDLTVGPEADPFYGYYTLHTLRDGKVAGMLSVNGETGEVWVHTWHGVFLGMAIGGDDEHE